MTSAGPKASGGPGETPVFVAFSAPPGDTAPETFTPLLPPGVAPDLVRLLAQLATPPPDQRAVLIALLAPAPVQPVTPRTTSIETSARCDANLDCLERGYEGIREATIS